MPSTYSTNNGIELIADGEQSGTWGATTNTNWNMVDQSLDGQLTDVLPATGSSGAPNTIAITDGAVSDGRNRLIVFSDGGDLGGTAFVQLTPNDAEKIMIVTNSLSGGRDINLFQGTYNASNDYTLANGETAIVKFDGGGAGAVCSVVGVLPATAVGTIASQDANSVSITGGTITGTTLDNGVIGGTTPAAGNFTNLDATGTLDVTGVSTFATQILVSSRQSVFAANGTALTDFQAVDGVVPPTLAVVDSVPATYGAAISAGTELVVMKDGNCQVSIIGGTASNSSLFFGDKDDEDVGDITYSHSANSMAFTTNATLALTLDSSQDATFAGTVSATNLSGTNTGDEVAASTTVSGIVELATDAEYYNNTSGKVLSTDQVWTAMAEKTLTDAASIAWNMDLGIDFTVTLAGNRTLANPTNAQVGKKGRVRVVQDATGSRTLAFGTSYEFAQGTAPTLTTTASAEDILFYDVISSTRILMTIVKDIS